MPIPFKLSDFIFHINVIQGRKAMKTEKASNSDRKEVDGIMRKLRALRGNPQLNFLLKKYDDGISLDGVLSQLILKRDDKDLKIIDISGIPN